MARSVGGLGLGHIARHLVAQGGRIWVQSDGPAAVRRSACPAGGRVAKACRSRSCAIGSTDRKRRRELAGIRVLLVDDEFDAREVMASALEACGGLVGRIGVGRAADVEAHQRRRAGVGPGHAG